jgi:Fe2+ or Zn2+ uptake regulation protein
MNHVLDYLLDIGKRFTFGATAWVILILLLEKPRTAKELANELELSLYTIYANLRWMTSCKILEKIDINGKTKTYRVI